MNNHPTDTLVDVLRQTRARELDCDEFQSLLAPFLDGRITDTSLCDLIAHHRQVCPECREELEILARVLSCE